MRKIFWFLPLLLIAFNNCGGPKVGGAASSGALNNNGISTPMVVSPSNANVAAYQNLQLSVTGGIAPYNFRLLSGAGVVGFNSGLYAAGGNPSTVIIQISDARGSTTTSTILVAGGGSTTTNPTVTPTNCSPILSAPNVAVKDTSSTGLSYATAANFNDPTSCANWCGSVGAGYCMFSPGSGTNAVCVGWPKGTSMLTYASAWVTYGGACQ